MNKLKLLSEKNKILLFIDIKFKHPRSISKKIREKTYKNMST